MSREEVKELVRAILRSVIVVDKQLNELHIHESTITVVIEAILNLGICKDCGGSGRIPGCQPFACLAGNKGTVICPTCGGTGLGEKLLVVVASDQEPPSWSEIPRYSGIEIAYFNGYMQAQQDMTMPKDGTVWRKVIV